MTDAAKPLHVFVVATEESGDKLGSALMQALKSRAGRPVIFTGVGGTAMQAEGLSSQFPISELAIIGIDAVIAKLRTILRLIRETATSAIAAKPDVLVYPICRLLTTCRPAYGRGGRAAPAQCAPTLIICWHCCRSSQKCIRNSAGRHVPMLVIRSATD